MPSMIGLVVIFEVTGLVTSSLSDNEINAIQKEVMSNFDVSMEQLTTSGNLIEIKF